MVKKPKKPAAKKASGLASLRGRPPEDEYQDIPDYPPEAYTRRPGEPQSPLRLPRPVRLPRIGDPEDYRTERYGMRIHPDLRAELEALAREEGFRLSQWIERVLIDAVNRARGRDVLDRVGRRRTR
jgi:hypothetical protein